MQYQDLSSGQIHSVQREGGTGQRFALMTTSNHFSCRFVVCVSQRHPRWSTYFSSQGFALLKHSFIYLYTSQASHKQFVWSCDQTGYVQRGMTLSIISVFEHKPVFLIGQMCNRKRERGGKGESCLTSVSASVALSSNSVMVFLTPSWTLIPRLCTTGKESSTGFMVMSNVWLTWGRRKSLSQWIQPTKSTTPLKWWHYKQTTVIH